MKLTIITVNFNNQAGLEQTIRSVKAQSWQDFEWIVIDGGSTDGSRQLIEQNAERFAFWCSERDSGIYNAMNKALARAQGDYVNFMNSGDWFADENVLEHVFSQEQTADVLYGDIRRYVNGKQIDEVRYQKQLSLYYFYISNINHQASFIRRETFAGHPYDETRRICADSKHFIRLMFEGATFLHLGIYVAHVDATGCSNTMANLEKIRKEKRANLEDVIPACVLQDFESYRQLLAKADNMVASEAIRYIKAPMLLQRIARVILKCLWPVR